MLCSAARVIPHSAMQSPTLTVLTDRNDLDDELFDQFQRCADMHAIAGENRGIRNKPGGLVVDFAHVQVLTVAKPNKLLN